MNYDYIIVGSGPSGITLAYYLGLHSKKVLLIDSEAEIGGCHRVRRINGLFTEHGPRIIINNYFCLKQILDQFDIKFDDLYVPYDFSTAYPTSKLLGTLTFREKLIFVITFLHFMVTEEFSKTITMIDFLKEHNFTEESISYIDILCRVSDGGTVDNYTLYEFLQIFNQNYLYTIYQPKYPNDVGLFRIWLQNLEKVGVTVMLNTKIISITYHDDQLKLVTSTNEVIEGSNYIFAIPPQPMITILNNSFNPNIFGNISALTQWEIASRYLVYIPIIFHWDTKLDLPKMWGATDTDYGLVYVIMSDYMEFNDPRSKTVIVCTVKNSDNSSTFIGKTANQCSKDELINEVFRQLKTVRPTLPNPQYSILDPGVYKNGDRYDTVDTAYFYTKAGFVDNASIFPNLWWVGTHNGHSNYSFTSMESAMQNAVYLLHKLIPVSHNNIQIYRPFTVKKLIWIIIIIIGVILLKLKL